LLEVPVKKLDDYRFDQVGFIKIDVEGHEQAVIEGAFETIARSKPVILVEVEEGRNPGAVARMQTALAKLGYAGHFYAHGVKQPIETFDVARHQPADLVWNSARYTRRTFPLVNNFLFSPQT